MVGYIWRAASADRVAPRGGIEKVAEQKICLMIPG